MNLPNPPMLYSFIFRAIYSTKIEYETWSFYIQIPVSRIRVVRKIYDSLIKQRPSITVFDVLDLIQELLYFSNKQPSALISITFSLSISK